MASPLSLFAYLRINWNGKPVFVFKAILFENKTRNSKVVKLHLISGEPVSIRVPWISIHFTLPACIKYNRFKINYIFFWQIHEYTLRIIIKDKNYLTHRNKVNGRNNFKCWDYCFVNNANFG
jgi:hypothetical protein